MVIINVVQKVEIKYLSQPFVVPVHQWINGMNIWWIFGYGE